MKPTLDIGQQMDIGVRRDCNEDFLGVVRPESEAVLAQRGVLLIVADGTGGEGFGDVASRTAVEVIRRVYYDDNFSEIGRALTRGIETANDVIRYLIKTSPGEASSVGVTLAAAVIRGTELVTANAGDCRVYLQSGGALTQISEDHPRDPSREDRQMGRYLGQNEAIVVAVNGPRQVNDGDMVLVCSDGVWGVVPAERLSSVLAGTNAQAAADELTRAANQAGGHDNIALVVCRVRTV